MIKVHLYGRLAKYGKSYDLDARSPAEVVRALCLQIPGLEEEVKDGHWHVIRGALSDKDSDTAESLTLEFGETRELHILPAVQGANSGIVNVIAGVVLIAVGVFTANPALIAMGAGMLIGGIVMMTTKMPTTDTDQESLDQKASFLFSRPTNSSSQGVAIPRGYGRFRTGSIVVSTSVVAEEILDESDTIVDHSGWLNDWRNILDL